MNFQNFYQDPLKLINDMENYLPYVIKVKCYNRDESDWLQNKPHYQILFNKYFALNNNKFPIRYIQKITFKTKDATYGKCTYEFMVSDNYYKNTIKNEKTYEKKEKDDNGK